MEWEGRQGEEQKQEQEEQKVGGRRRMHKVTTSCSRFQGSALVRSERGGARLARSSHPLHSCQSPQAQHPC
eukprot:439507-Hanusia_phi.AAC.1